MTYSDAALCQLERWGVTADTAERAGLFDTPNATQIYPEFQALPALVIPYYDTQKQLMTFDPGAQPFCRVRYLETTRHNGFATTKAYRYGQPKASSTRAYFPLLIDWQKLLNDPQEPLIITEGEAKAIAGCAAGIPVLALGGVYNFGGEAFLPELEAIVWRGRDVFIVFDSDAATNPNVLTAEARLVDELQRKRGARCYIVRLPPSDDGGKVGIDDFLKAHGAAEFLKLLQSASPLGALDAKVLSLNRSVAWIERESLVYDLETYSFIPKDSFVAGSRFSALEHTTLGATQRSAPKRISVAKTWLTHPHAQRFAEVLFRPGEGAMVQTEQGKPALNLWRGIESSDGDVTPFLKLTNYLLQHARADLRDFPLQLMAYKAQNPERKVPIALMFVGDQGTGKSLWCECMTAAFRPYSQSVDSAMFHGQFRGWLEKTLLAFIDEVEHEHIRKGGAVLKNLISAQQHPMNEKFRAIRQVRSYTQYLLTTNERAAAAFAADDRRMAVIGTPSKSERLDPEFYRTVQQWRDSGGGPALMGWLLRYDLKGWYPPAAPPLSDEKHLAYTESLTPIQALAEDMLNSTEGSPAKRWVAAARAWAGQNVANSNIKISAQAQATLESTLRWPIRPWYEPRELALMFPHLVATQLGAKYDYSMPAGLISRQLREAGVPYLICRDNPKGFRWQGQLRQYLVVADFDDWKAPLAQAEFERLMNATPHYGSIKR